MYKIHNIKPLSFLSLLLLLFVSGCSVPQPSPYPPANPIVFAFQHQLNLDPVLESIVSDSLGFLDTIDGGLKLYTNSIYGDAYEMEVWLNDSILLVNIKAFLCDYWENVNNTAGRVRFEAQLRNERAGLGDEVLKNFNSGVLHFYNKSSFTGEDHYEIEHHRNVPLEIQKDQLKKIDQLSWHGKVFEQEMHLNFKEGIIDGALLLKDTQTVKQGIYDAGFEIGDWKVYDHNDNLQWTEIYQKGELQEVIYENTANIKRDEPLPTFRYIVILHRVVFYTLFLATLVVVFFYFKSLLQTKRPYKGNKNMEVFLKVLSSPILTFASIVLFILLFLLIINLFSLGGNWDIPWNFALLFFYSFYYFLIGTIFFIATFRYLDVFWHAGLLVLLYLVYEEYIYLDSIQAGIF